MRLILLTMPLVLLSGCAAVTVTRDSGPICDGTRADRTAHVEALLADGGPQSLITGQHLISRLDAACSA